MTPTQHIKAAATYFALVFGAGFMLGTLRVLLLVPRLGERTAELLELPLMILVSAFAATFIVHRFALPRHWVDRAIVGVIALVLLLGAELVLAVLIQDRSLAEYIAARDPVSGLAYLLALLFYAAMPCTLLYSKRAARRR